MKKASMSKMTKAPKKMMKKGGMSMKKYAKEGTITTGDPGERFRRKADKEAARAEFKKQKLANKLERQQTKTEARQVRKSTEAQGDAAVDRALTQKKTNRAGRIGELISRIRSSERNVNVTGNRKLFGRDSNNTTTNTDNSVTNKTTTTTSGGGAGGSSGSSSRSGSGSSSGSSSRAMQKQEQRDMRKNNSDNKSNSNVGGIQSKGVGNQKKGGISKTKMMKGGTTMAKKKMMTGGMTNPNKSASVTKSATKYTGGKNGTMMMKGGTTKKKMMYGGMSKRKK